MDCVPRIVSHVLCPMYCVLALQPIAHGADPLFHRITIAISPGSEGWLTMKALLPPQM